MESAIQVGSVNKMATKELLQERLLPITYYLDLESKKLKFRTSKAITKPVGDQVIEIFVKQTPQYRTELESEFARADVVGEFRRMIAKYGYDPNNLAHNMTAFLILQ